MRKFTIANNSMIEELIELLIIGFDENDKSVNFFFDNMANLDNCAICIEDDRIVAQLHMLPMKIRNSAEFIDCHYIYAATTHPKYRNKGCMTELITYAHKVADSKGQKYSILSPANQNLYDFYRKFGYYRFYKYKEIVLTNQEMSKFKPRGDIFKDIDYSKIQEIRSNFYDKDAEILWDINSIKYAFDMNANLLGENIYNGSGYAISFVTGSGEINIVEIAYYQNEIEGILGHIYNAFKNGEKYIVRVPVRDTSFGKKGIIRNKAMICPICDRAEKKKLMSFIMEKASAYPCMGFVLE